MSASGFLGFPVNPLSKAMIDYIDTREAEIGMDALSDQDDEGNTEADEEDEQESVGYFNVARLMKLYRAGIRNKEYSLLESLEVIDSLCKGDESTFADVLATLSISAEDAYNDIEASIVKKLKKTK